MITNFDKTPVFIFFTDLYKIIKTVIIHITKLLLAEYNIVEPNKPKIKFKNNNNNNNKYKYKPFTDKPPEVKIDFLNDLPKPVYGIPAKQDEPLMAHNIDDNHEFSYDTLKPSTTIEPLHTMNITDNFTKPNIPYKKECKQWDELDYVNRPWFITDNNL
jgi:hypothetical protein